MSSILENIDAEIKRLQKIADQSLHFGQPACTAAEDIRTLKTLRRVIEPKISEGSLSQHEYELDQYMRHNKWSVRVVRRGTDYDTAEIVKCKDFPDERVLARAVWPDQAQTVCDEHNDSLAKSLFKQDDAKKMVRKTPSSVLFCNLTDAEYRSWIKSGLGASCHSPKGLGKLSAYISVTIGEAFQLIDLFGWKSPNISWLSDSQIAIKRNL